MVTDLTRSANSASAIAGGSVGVIDAPTREHTRPIALAPEDESESVVLNLVGAHSDEVGRRFRAKPAACTD
jgi:hypothetical protein